MMKAGDAKVPLTSTTKVTEESLEYVQNNLDQVHDAFRDMVSEARGKALLKSSYEKVTNGDVFLGKQALQYGLVDRLMTSDEYISERVQAGDRVLKLHKYDKARMGMRFSPLDLLLLKNNGLLGKSSVVRTALNWVNQIAPAIIKFSTTVGLIQVLDKNYVRARIQRNDVREI
jgi:ClpP class serine protease